MGKQSRETIHTTSDSALYCLSMSFAVWRSQFTLALSGDILHAKTTNTTYKLQLVLLIVPIFINRLTVPRKNELLDFFD